jgi:pyridoxamine 5'-phosphate oxidase
MSSAPDDLTAILAQAWHALSNGVASRRLPAHTPTVATIGLDGRPRLRTIVLRGVLAVDRQIRFHTDVRSDKVAELKRDPRFSLHAYDPAAKLQIRLEGEAILHIGNVKAREAWIGSRRFSQICYGINPGPGTPIANGGGFALPVSDDDVEGGFGSFCAVIGSVKSLEWLYLAHDANRRARFVWDEAGELKSSWLTP